MDVSTTFPASRPPLPGTPGGATDCHAHVFDPARFPLAAARRYTPPPATVDDLVAFLAGLGTAHVVIVQPSVYGTDNSCLCDALRRLGGRARGVAVVAPGISHSEISALQEAGVCGLRLNLEVSKNRDAGSAEGQFERMAWLAENHGLIIHLNAALPVIDSLAASITACRVPVVLDHFAHVPAQGGVEQEGFSALTALLQAGHVYLKLSAPYQVSQEGPDYSDIAPVAEALIDVAPARILWGSDWPHTGGANRPADYCPTDIEPFRKEDDKRNLALLSAWARDEQVRRMILVDNPRQLYQIG